VVRVKLPVWVPDEEFCQQSGIESAFESTSSEEFATPQPVAPFATLTGTPALVAVLPLVSVARAASVTGPSGTLVESHASVYGAVVSVPTTVPSARKSTPATATSSPALAARATLVPLTTAFAAGVVNETVGALVSALIAWSSTVIDPADESETPNERRVAPAGTGGVVHTSCEYAADADELGPFAKQIHDQD
jgi:hypothetical protein